MYSVNGYTEKVHSANCVRLPYEWNNIPFLNGIIVVRSKIWKNLKPFLIHCIFKIKLSWMYGNDFFFNWRTLQLLLFFTSNITEFWFLCHFFKQNSFNIWSYFGIGIWAQTLLFLLLLSSIWIDIFSIVSIANALDCLSFLLVSVFV